MPALPLHAARRPGQFQVIATLGPASFPLAAEMASAGATAFRLNASHLKPTELRQRLEEVCARRPGYPVVVDLQGAKMRLGVFEDQPLRQGDEVAFALEPRQDERPLPHPELFAAVQPGNTLSCDDDRLRFRVVDVRPGRLLATAATDGTLKARKGINLVDHPVSLQDLSDADLEHVHVAQGFPDVHFAFSFMTDGREAAWVKRRAPERLVLGKLERPEAITKLSAVESGVDATWVCRGDLGAQWGIPAMARWVGWFDPRRRRRPVLMAGQVLEHLTHHATPTRSEACHLFDVVARGYAGVVLSDETAVGRDPVNAVATAHLLLTAYLQGEK